MTHERRDSFRLLAALTATLLATAAHAAVAPRHLYTLGQRVVSAPEERFGASLATDDVRVLVGSPFAEDSVPSAQLFRADTGSFERVLVDPAGSVDDHSFGSSVALLGGSAVVGAPRQGMVHLFDATSGALVRSIASPDPEIPGFGAALASTGTILVVGTYVDMVYLIDTTTGAVLRRLTNPVAGGNGRGAAIAAAPGLSR